MTLSLRAKVLLIVLGCAVLPLALFGAWLTHSGRRSGEELLRGRLRHALTAAAQETGMRWVQRRSGLLAAAEHAAVRAALSGSDGVPVDTILLALPAGALWDAQRVIIRDAASHVVWSATAPGPATLRLVRVAGGDGTMAALPHALPVRLPIYDAAGARTLGTIEAWYPAAALMPSGGAAGVGAVLAVVDRATGAGVSALPLGAPSARERSFRWGGEEWLAEWRSLHEPEFDLLAAAPATPYTVPFARAATRGLLALLIIAAAAGLVSVLLTRRVTESLVHLADAADAVAHGDLDRRVEATTHDEVGRLAAAFNAMIGSLRRTLDELAQRQATAAVGEFASALAHEIRNPLSAVRLNLQHLQERLSAQASLQEPLAHALRDVRRLDATLHDALRVARTGRMAMTEVDVREPLAVAARAAAATFPAHDARLEAPGELPHVRVRGNAAALEQLFLNLLINAAQAGDRAWITVHTGADAVTVEVCDNGPGFTAEARARAFDAFFTTRPEGTGLGLALARRIAAAHGGSLEIGNAPAGGACVQVRLPRSPVPAGNTTSRAL